MTLSLYIRNEFIESLEVDVMHALLISQRIKIVWEFAGYLRDKYRMDIMLAREWEIILTTNSKLNGSKVYENNP